MFPTHRLHETEGSTCVHLSAREINIADISRSTVMVSPSSKPPPWKASFMRDYYRETARLAENAFQGGVPGGKDIPKGPMAPENQIARIRRSHHPREGGAQVEVKALSVECYAFSMACSDHFPHLIRSREIFLPRKLRSVNLIRPLSKACVFFCLPVAGSRSIWVPCTQNGGFDAHPPGSGTRSTTLTDPRVDTATQLPRIFPRAPRPSS